MSTKDRFRDRDERPVDVSWVDTLRKPESYTGVPNAVLWNAALTLGERVTYAALARFSGLQACQVGEWCAVGTAALSALTGMKRTSVQRILKRLEGKGLISVDRTSGGRGRGAANSYRLRFVIGPKGHVLDRGSLVQPRVAPSSNLGLRVQQPRVALSKAVSATVGGKSESVNCISEGAAPSASLSGCATGRAPEGDSQARVTSEDPGATEQKPGREDRGASVRSNKVVSLKENMPGLCQKSAEGILGALERAGCEFVLRYRGSGVPVLCALRKGDRVGQDEEVGDISPEKAHELCSLWKAMSHGVT